ncbi:MAG TPA: ATP-binding protein, partial [Steroidobacteraceae bacterium]
AENDEEDSLHAGAEICLTEPVEPRELVTVVRVLLRLHSTERGLLESEARWRSFVESNIVGVLIVENGRIVEANEAFLRMVGYTQEDLRTQNITWQTITPPEGHELSLRALEELRRTGSAAPFEKQYIRKDGGRVWVTIGCVAIDETLTRWMCFVLDISERKRAEEERELAFVREHHARTVAEQATRLKDEFLANLSHELRTPMNAIVGWAHLLRTGKLDEAQKVRAFEAIERAARSQAQLIEDLLDVSRIVSGKLRLTIQTLDLAPLLNAWVENQRLAAQAKGVTLQVQLPGVPVMINGDANRLQQVVWNLLSNAIKFTPSGGRVTVKLERVGDNAEITVADTGEGISPDFLPYVFDRFRQADGTSTRRHSGLGLGLAIVRHVTELHGGSVRAHSEGEGRGATFVLTIPLSRAELANERARSALVPPESRRSAGNTVRVLVVDDHEETREVLAAILERNGFIYRVASCASDALMLLDAWRPDVVVSDISMPGMDGYEFARRLRERSREMGGEVPALALTAFARGEDQAAALKHGYQAHIAKPVNPDDLVRAILSLAERAHTHRLDSSTRGH